MSSSQLHFPLTCLLSVCSPRPLPFVPQPHIQALLWPPPNLWLYRGSPAAALRPAGAGPDDPAFALLSLAVRSGFRFHGSSSSSTRFPRPLHFSIRERQESSRPNHSLLTCQNRWFCLVTPRRLENWCRCDSTKQKMNSSLCRRDVDERG